MATNRISRAFMVYDGELLECLVGEGGGSDCVFQQIGVENRCGTCHIKTQCCNLSTVVGGSGNRKLVRLT